MSTKCANLYSQNGFLWPCSLIPLDIFYRKKKMCLSNLKTKTDYFSELELIYSRKAFFYLTVRELINISMNTDRKFVCHFITEVNSTGMTRKI